MEQELDERRKRLMFEDVVYNISYLMTSVQFKMEGPYFEIRKTYLDALLKNQTREATRIIHEAKEQKIPLAEIYEYVLTKVLYEIGELWHRNIITVDKEHYATSVTQTVMAGFYEDIFDRPARNRTLVSCAVGNELHELGIRMLTDIFEEQGWDTYYLGAALPESALLDAVDTHHPDVVALSVTMPPYLSVCEKMVQLLKENHPTIKIAVGGLAFRNTDYLWEKWGVDFYAPTAKELLLQVEKHFNA